MNNDIAHQYAQLREKNAKEAKEKADTFNFIQDATVRLAKIEASLAVLIAKQDALQQDHTTLATAFQQTITDLSTELSTVKSQTNIYKMIEGTSTEADESSPPKFDRNTYQREYMRKRRAAQKSGGR